MTRSRLDVAGYEAVRSVAVDRAGALIEARDITNGGTVVIRLLSPAVVAARGAQRRLRRDMSRLERLRHPGLVAVLAFDERAGAVVVERQDGVTLPRLLRGPGPMPVEPAFTTLHNLLAALAALHGSGVLHRDVRPDAVLVDAAGTARLRDAGIASPALRAGWAAGTPGYMAPELWRGGRQTLSTDLYAVTAVLFECLTGRPPFDSADLRTLRDGHLRQPVPGQLVPAPARALVVRGLAKDPRDRPRSAAEHLLEVEKAAAEWLEVGWYQAGARWLSDSASALLAGPPPAEVPFGSMLAEASAAPEGLIPASPAGTAGASRAGVRRRLTILGAIGAAAFVAAALVVIAVSLLGHTGGGGVDSSAQNAAVTQTQAPSPGGPSAQGGTPTGGQPSPSTGPGTSASASPSAEATFIPPPAAPPSFQTIEPSPTASSPASSPSATGSATPCPTTLPTPLATPCPP